MLSRHSLKNTILPIISIDEYEPKTGSQEDVIVVGFHTIDEDPAKDLNSFINKSVIDVLDVEVSPNPDEDGHYLVFVELQRDQSFFKKLFSLIRDIENVSGKMDWKVKPYLSDDEIDLNDKALFDYVIVIPKNYVTKSDFEPAPGKGMDFEESIESFIKESGVLQVSFKSANMRIASTHATALFETVDFGSYNDVIRRNKLSNTPLKLIDPGVRMRDVELMLGAGWSVTEIGKYVIITNENTNKALLTKLLE